MFGLVLKAAIAGAVLPRLGAAECQPMNSTTVIPVFNQTDIDTNLKDCTTVSGSIIIQGTYQGIFNLSGIINVSEIVTMGIHTDGLTSIVMDDLTYAGHLQLGGMSAVNSISLPKLTNATNIEFQAFTSTKVSCPALVSAEAVNFTGDISSMDFPLLANSNISTIDVPGDISFPALKSANTLSMKGNFSSFSMPLLESIAFDKPSNETYELSHYGSYSSIQPAMSINMSFPALKNVDDLNIQNINNLSFPSLRSARYLNLSSGANQTDDFVFNFTSLVDVGGMMLKGNFSNVLLPSLERLNTSMNINSTMPLNCTSAQAAFDHANSLNGNNMTLQKLGEEIPKTITCVGIPPPPPKKINKLAYGLGFTFGLGGGVAAILLIAFVWRTRNENREARALGVTKKEMRARKIVEAKGKGRGGEGERVVASENSA